MTARIFLKLLVAVVCLLVLAMGAVDLVAIRVAESHFVRSFTRDVEDKARLVSLSRGRELPGLDEAALKAMAQAAGGRLTLIDRSGRVLGDSEAHAAEMENHATRPEFIEALRGRSGSSIRHSATLNVDFLYAAVPLPDGALRIAVPLSEVDRQVASLRTQLLIAVALAFLPAIVVAILLARGIAARLAEIIAFAGELAKGNFQARLEHVRGDELGLLGRQLNETGENLQKIVSQLDREHAELERLERIRKDFVINVSHELRTPLASIQGYTETLMDGALHDPEYNQRFLGIIRHNAERLTRLTADLLTLSRIELGRHRFEFEIRDLNELILGALDTMRPMALKKGLRLDFQPLAEDPRVHCDAEAVHQIASNLLDNAIKYSPGDSSVTVGARPLDAGWVEVFVHNTGAGIPAEDLPRLFERFYRVDKARSRNLGGTGLGLTIVKHLVRGHRGEVRVESEPDRGATFYFTLPRPEAAAGRDAEWSAPVAAPFSNESTV